MNDNHLPALAPATLPTGQDLNGLLQVGDMLVKSGLMPQSLRTKEAAAVVVMKGHELGLPPMAAIEGIAVVQGRAVIGAHLMLALVKRAYGPGAIWVSETDNEHCTISYRIPGVPQVLTYSFTMADARQAGLAEKQTWRQYPAAMLRARAISAAVKIGFPEVVGGMYVPGELPGTEERVTDDGDVVISVSARPVQPDNEPVVIEAVVSEPAPAAEPPRTVQVDVETGEIMEPAAPPRPSKRSLGQRALSIAIDKNMPSEELEAIGVEVANGRAKAQWTIEDMQALIARLEDMEARPSGQAPLVEAEPVAVDGEAGNDRWAN